MSTVKKHDFQTPTQGQLDNLMEGCFVCVNDTVDSYWVEIDKVNADGLSGIIHTELDSNDTHHDNHRNKRVCFQSDQVTYLGCDRYCFC